MAQNLSLSLHRLVVVGFSALVLGGISLPAQAQEMLTIKNGYGGFSNVNAGGNNYSVFDGDFTTTLTGGPPGFPSIFESYCVDLNHPSAPSNTAYTVNQSSASTLTRGGQVSWLAENDLFLFAKEGGTPNQQRAALQLAIWNTLYDTDKTVSIGTFNVGFVSVSGADSLANLYLADLGEKTSSAGTQFKDSVSSTGSHPYQALIKSNTPEPGSVAYLTILGAGSLALLRRRVRKSGGKRALK